MASACQDELGHAQVMYRLLEDFGYDTHEFLFERDPEEWRTFQMLEFPHEDYIETVVSMCYGDRVGYITTVDLEENCSYAPLARGLRKSKLLKKLSMLVMVKSGLSSFGTRTMKVG